MLRAITAYLRVIQSRESVKYAVQSVANIKKQTELEDAAVTAGGGLTSDVLQAKTQLAGAQARQIQFEGVLSAAKHEFEYVFETFPRDLNSLMLLKSVFNDLPKTVEEAEKSAKYPDALIGINNRNLKTLKTEINTTYDIYDVVSNHSSPLISESGLKTKDELLNIKNRTSINTFLIGESLLKDLENNKIFSLL